jgi:hypothetical protein
MPFGTGETLETRELAARGQTRMRPPPRTRDHFRRLRGNGMTLAGFAGSVGSGSGSGSGGT